MRTRAPVLASLSLLALLLVVCACGRKHEDATAVEEAAPQSVDELRSRVQKVVDETGLPGVGIAIVADGEVVYAGGVGRANLADATPITADTSFRVGSITKSFVSLAMLKLVEDGKISLDAKLAALAPEVVVENPWESTNPVSIANLLEHTAGFDDMHFSELLNTTGPDLPLRDVLAVCPASRRPRWAPGTRMSYSNPGYTVAAYVLEKLTGRAHEDHIRDTLLVPLGMTHAGMRLTKEILASLARGYEGPRHRPAPLVAIHHRPAGNLVASPAELAQLVRLFLHRGKVGEVQLLAPTTIERAERCETLPWCANDGLVTKYGLGNYATAASGFLVHGHDGGIDGFTSNYGYVVEGKVGWVVLFNTSGMGDARDRVRKLVVAFATRGLSRPTLPTRDVPPETLASYVGYYRLASPRNEALRFLTDLTGGKTIELEQGALRAHGVGSAPVRLVPTSATLFRREKDGGASVLFARDAAGTQVMVDNTAYYEKTSPWPRRLHLATLVGSFALALSSIGYALVWGVRWIGSRRFRALGHFSVRGLPLLATLAFCAFLGSFAALSSIGDVATRNPKSIALFVTSLAHPVLSVVALFVAARSLVRGDRMNRVAKAHALLVASANAVLATYLWAWGLVAIRVWSL